MQMRSGVLSFIKKVMETFLDGPFDAEVGRSFTFDEVIKAGHDFVHEVERFAEIEGTTLD